MSYMAISHIFLCLDHIMIYMIYDDHSTDAGCTWLGQLEALSAS